MNNLNNQQQNWLQFQHGGTQYGTPGAASYTPAQSGYVATPSYGTTTQRTTPGYDQSQYTSQTYATTPQYEYGYGRPAQTYDTTKTYYQQASASYVQPTYDSTAAKAPVTTYSQPAARTTIQQKPTQYSTAYDSQATMATKQAQPATTTTANHQNAPSYQNAFYSAASAYIAQQNNKTANTNANQQTGWPKKTNNFKPRKNVTPKPQQIHYCDVCKISCAGPQTYREHLDGQKHKKREALQKAQTDTTATTGQQTTTTRGSNLRCELCDVTCTGNDAYSAHVRGSKHQKVVKLHTKLGKPIPSTEPTPIGNPKDKEGADDDIGNEDIKPVGEEYIEEMKDPETKVVTFNCKLCDCKFNDPNAKEMHTKGRRHRLQYKKKVQPDLVVDVKPTLRQRKLAEREKQRQQMQEEIWNRRNRMVGDAEMDEEERMYWEERRRAEDEMGLGSGDWNRFPMRGRPLMGFQAGFNVMNGRRVDTQDDRHVMARHAEIYPKEEELQAIQKIVSHTERALKLVSDAMTVQETTKDEKMEVQNDSEAKTSAASTESKSENKENGSQNQMITFQKDTEGSVRLLKGVMRVGLLAKGLLLQGDNNVQLVVLCAEKPTSAVLKRVVQELPIQLKKVSEDAKYTVTMAPVEGAVTISDGTITVKVSLTSPLLREPGDSTTSTESVSNSEDLLPREPCLQALRALRQSKWFQARATGLISCVMTMRILRDLCQRNPSFTPLSQWAMELLTEKVIASAGVPLSPGDCLRRMMECLASGFLIKGPGLMDPCEKEPVDALNGLSKQQREDITQRAQQFLRYIAFRQIHKVLGMDPLPVQKYQGNRPWKFNTSRKRRRSGTEPSEGDGQKIVKKEGESNVSEAAAEKMN